MPLLVYTVSPCLSHLQVVYELLFDAGQCSLRPFHTVSLAFLSALSFLVLSMYPCTHINILCSSILLFFTSLSIHDHGCFIAKFTLSITPFAVEGYISCFLRAPPHTIPPSATIAYSSKCSLQKKL